MALLIDSPSFTANEVYEIQATDPVEGAASGASFGGLGLSNQPHQQLANRTRLSETAARHQHWQYRSAAGLHCAI